MFTRLTCVIGVTWRYTLTNYYIYIIHRLCNTFMHRFEILCRNRTYSRLASGSPTDRGTLQTRTKQLMAHWILCGLVMAITATALITCCVVPVIGFHWSLRFICSHGIGH